MRFSGQRRKATPTIIIVALIDILIVILIFLVVTTTFKQQPAIKLALPESKQLKAGTSEKLPLIVTIAKQEPFFFLAENPITLDRLQEMLASRAAKTPDIALTIRADTDAPFGKIINVMDAAKAANIRAINAVTRSPGGK